MNKIKNFKVENFKSLKNIELEINNLTLLTGVNSSGKSSFIQAMLLLKQNWETLSFPFPNKPLSINGNLVNLGNKKDILFQEIYDENITITISKKLNENDLKSLKRISTDKKLLKQLKTQNNIHNIYFSFNTNDLIYTSNFDFSNFFLNNYNLNTDFQYIQTNRIEPDIFYDLSDESINNDNIGTRGEYTAHYLAEKRHQDLYIDKLIHPLSKTSQLLENVSLWLNEISNGVEISTKIYNELQKVNLTYKYIYKDSTTNDYTPLNVGYGLTFVLPIIVAILKAKPNSLLIIENPESHLHAAAQSIIAKLCAIAAQNEVQIIIETHSDHFLNSIRVATKENIINNKNISTYYFRKEINHLETIVDNIEIDQYGNINNYPKGFFDEWDNNLDKLLGL